MQALARQQWFKRAKDLGMVPDEVFDPNEDAEAILRYSITGGQPPPGASNDRSDSSESRTEESRSEESRSEGTDPAEPDPTTSNTDAAAETETESAAESTPESADAESGSPEKSS
jgi:hypothetical protein